MYSSTIFWLSATASLLWARAVVAAKPFVATMASTAAVILAIVVLPERISFRSKRDALEVFTFAHILFGKPVSTFPGYALTPKNSRRLMLESPLPLWARHIVSAVRLEPDREPLFFLA